MLKNKNLAIVFVGLCVLIMVLAVGIVWMQNNSGGDEFDDIEEAEEWKGLEAEISMAESVDEAIKIYQKYLDEAKTDDEKVDIYNQRVDYIMQNEEGDEYSDQAMNDMIAIDGILKTVSSAAQVYNMADEFGYDDITKKYDQIVEERSKAEGDNLDEKSNG